LTKTKTKSNGKWYKKIFTVPQERKVKVEEERSVKRFFKRFKAKYFGTKKQILRQVQNVVVVSVIILVYILYGFGVWFNSFSAFWTTSIVAGVRILAYLISSISEEKEWDELGTTALADRLRIISLHILMWLAITMGANLIYDYRFWYKLGLVELWFAELTFTINILLIFIPIVFGLTLIMKRDALKSTDYLIQQTKFRNIGRQLKKRNPKKDVSSLIKGEIFQYKLSWYFTLVFAVIIPIVFFIILMPYFRMVDEVKFGGVLSTLTYAKSFQAQGFTTYFGLVFYILFQQPIPMFMVAFMTFATIAVLMAQSQGRAGRLSVGVAVAISAVLPLIFVLMALTTAIPPPVELTDPSYGIGLDPAIAGFVYGLGLILTYIIAITIMGVFVTSSRVLTGVWSPT
jgi:hypothetical protein